VKTTWYPSAGPPPEVVVDEPDVDVTEVVETEPELDEAAIVEVVVVDDDTEDAEVDDIVGIEALVSATSVFVAVMPDDTAPPETLEAVVVVEATFSVLVVSCPPTARGCDGSVSSRYPWPWLELLAMMVRSVVMVVLVPKTLVKLPSALDWLALSPQSAV